MGTDEEIEIFVGDAVDFGFHYKAVSVPRVGETITFREIKTNPSKTTTLKVIEVEWYIVAGTRDTRVSSVNIKCEIINSVEA